MKRIAFVMYRRVSTEEQATKGYSLPEQESLCRAKIKEILDATDEPVDEHVVDFVDTMGGGLLDRPVLEAVRDYVKEHKPAYFVCMDPDRFSRELFIQLLVTREIEAAGTQLVFVQHRYETTAEGKLFYSMRGAVAEFEKAKILERTKRGMRGKLKQGKLPYHVFTYGYRFNKETDMPEVYEAEAVWVRQIFRWASEQVRPMDIRNRLVQLGVPTRRGGKWYTSTIRGMLRNRTYTGKMSCNRYDWTGMTALMQLPKDRRTVPIRGKQRPVEEWITIEVPPIIDEALFDDVQRTFRTVKQRSKEPVGLISGMVRCGVCGGAVHYVAHKWVGHYLRCINRYPSSRDARVVPEKCALPYTQASVIEERVWAEVVSWLTYPQAILQRIERTQDTNPMQGRIAQLETEIASLQTALTEQEEVQMTTLRQQTKGNISDSVADKLLAEAKAEADRCTKEIAKRASALAELRKAVQDPRRFADRLSSMSERMASDRETALRLLVSLPEQDRRFMVCNLVESVDLMPDKTCKVHPLTRA